MDIITNLINIISIVSILFVLALFMSKLYIKIRSKFNIKVNCWFCNQNIRIPYNNLNEWYCPNCEQYNGFNKHGDYNKEILSQYYESNTRYCKALEDTSKLLMANETSKNGLCNKCNENQSIKIERLSQFEPETENTFDDEIKIYRENLENLYRLCAQCEKNVQKTLCEKKKIILGLKLNYFIKKSSIELKKLKSKSIINKNWNTINNQTILNNFNTIFLFILSIVNFYIVLNDFTEVNQKHLHTQKDSMILHIMTIILSNISTVTTYIKYYVHELLAINIITKTTLYMKTIVYILFCTFFQFKKLHSYFFTVTFVNNVIQVFGILFAFINSILNGFKINKYTIILTMWSVCSGISSLSISSIRFLKADTIENITLITIKMIFSSIIVVLSIPKSDSSSKNLLFQNKNNFHRIYSGYSITKKNDLNFISEQQYNNNYNSNSKEANSEHLLKCNLLSANTPNSTIKIPSIPSLNFSPTSAFKNYSKLSSRNSFHNFHNISSNNNSLNFNECSIYSPSLHLGNLNLSSKSSLSILTSPSIINNSASNSLKNINTNISANVPAVNNKVNMNNSYTAQRLNLISPSHFSEKSNYMFTSQYGVSGEYFNHNSNQFSSFLKRKTLLNLNNNNKENWSRASSQSSGFESQTSFTALNIFENKIYNDNGNNISRENSYYDDIDNSGENISEINCSSPLLSWSSTSCYPHNHHSPKNVTFVDTHKNDFLKLEPLLYNKEQKLISLNINANSDILNKYSNTKNLDIIFPYNGERQKKEGIDDNQYLYFNQKQQKELNNKIMDPFDLNVMNKNLSLIQNHCKNNSYCWRKQSE